MKIVLIKTALVVGFLYAGVYWATKDEIGAFEQASIMGHKLSSDYCGHVILWQNKTNKLEYDNRGVAYHNETLWAYYTNGTVLVYLEWYDYNLNKGIKSFYNRNNEETFRVVGRRGSGGFGGGDYEQSIVNNRHPQITFKKEKVVLDK